MLASRRVLDPSCLISSKLRPTISEAVSFASTGTTNMQANSTTQAMSLRITIKGKSTSTIFSITPAKKKKHGQTYHAKGYPM
jgi:hypothetical protein